MDIIEKFKNYISNINKRDKIAVVYHGNCADGLCSAIILNKAVERISKRKIDFNMHYLYYEVKEELIDFVKANKINKVIFVDLSIYVKEDMIRKLEKYAEILLIDHHEYETDLNDNRLTFVHSTFIDNKIKSPAYPASKLVYDIFSKIIDISDLDWLSCLGLISDMGYDQWKGFVIKTGIKYKAKINENVFLSDLGICSSNISTSKRFNDNIEKVFNVVYKAKTYKNILHNKFLLSYKKKANEELQHWINNRINAENYKDLVIYEIKPKYPIGTTLATILSREYFKNKTVVIISEDIEDMKLKLNARNQIGTLRTNDLLVEATKGLKDSNAGGHAPAAGGGIYPKDLERFKKQLKEAYDKLSK